MGTNARKQTPDLVTQLTERGDRFSFFQALRLLRQHVVNQGKDPEVEIRVHPRLGLGFPNTDLSSIRLDREGHFKVTANFMGLYGVDSPLPMFYTEDLLREQSDGYTVNREFLDIFSQSVYPLFFHAWLKTRPSLRIVERNDHRMLAILYAFVGLDSPLESTMLPGQGSLLQCGAFFSQRTRSAEGLTGVIRTSFPKATVRVRQLQPVWVPIPPVQHFLLGEQSCSLGDDAHVGGHCRALNGITIALTNLTAETYLSILRGGKEHERLRFLVDYYLIEPVYLKVELELKPNEAGQIRLGSSHWSLLGHNTWLLPHDSAHQNPRASFNISTRRSSPRWA